MSNSEEHVHKCATKIEKHYQQNRTMLIKKYYTLITIFNANCNLNNNQ